MSLVDAIIFSGGKAAGGGGVTPPPSPDDYIPVVVGDSPITLVSGSRYSFNTSGGPITANLPVTPTQGYAVYVYFDSVSDLNHVTFNAGSETIEGSSSLIAGAAYNGLFYTLAWNETESDWKVTQTSNTDGSSGGSSVGESSIVAIRALTKLISGADVQDFSTGNWYEYDAVETSADDGINYLTPNSIIEPAPGRWVLKRSGGLSVIKNDLSGSLSDEFSDIKIGDRFHQTINRDQTLKSILAAVEIAPIGSPIVISAKKNGISILTSNIEIPSGSKYIIITPPQISDTSLIIGNELLFEVVSHGASTPGISLKVYPNTELA